MNHGQQYGSWDLPSRVGPPAREQQKSTYSNNNASRLASEISRMRDQPTSRQQQHQHQQQQQRSYPSRSAPSNTPAAPPPPPPPPSTNSASMVSPQVRTISNSTRQVASTKPLPRTTSRAPSIQTTTPSQYKRGAGQGVSSTRAAAPVTTPSAPFSSKPSTTTTTPFSPMQQMQPAPTSMGGTIPPGRRMSSVTANPADVVRDMRRAERQQAKTALDQRVKRAEDLRSKPSADASRELHRRNSTPGYMAARVIQGVDWNRDAFLSQQSYNHAMAEARKLEKTMVSEFNELREGQWHTDIGAASKVLQEKTMPQHSRGMIPIGSGAASKSDSAYLSEHAGSSFVPEQKQILQGRYRDEDHLYRIFRTFDTRFDGAITSQSFRTACRYLGIEQAHGRHAVDELARKAGSDRAGNVLYQNAIPLMEILPRPGTEQRDRVVTGAIVPDGMLPRPSNTNPLVGPLGDVGYLATSPWGSASSERKGGNEHALSQGVKAQLNRGPKTEEEIRMMHLVGPIQERLLSAESDKKGAAVRLKAALRNADLDRDGALGYADFKHTLSTKLGIDLSPYEMEQVSQHFDAGGAGQIDYYQMVKALEASGEESSRKQANERNDMASRQSALAKLRDSVRGKVWKFEDTFKRMDQNGDGMVSAQELSLGLHRSGVTLRPDEDVAIRKWAGDGIDAKDFIRELDRPIRAHQSQLGGGGVTNMVEEDPYEGRGKRIVYQGSNGDDFQSQYNYLDSGFLTQDQRTSKLLMHKIVEKVQRNHLRVYEKGGGPIMEIFESVDPEKKGEVPRGKFEKALHRLGMDLSHEDRNRLVKQFRGSSDGWVNYNDFFKVVKHEQNETRQRPHTSSQIGFSKGQLSSNITSLEREKGKRIYSIQQVASDHERNTMLDHHDSFGRSGQAVDLAENLHTTWIPRTQEELTKVRKISDILSSSRDRLSNRFRSQDVGHRGVITNRDFINSVRDECGHLMREEDINWLADRAFVCCFVVVVVVVVVVCCFVVLLFCCFVFLLLSDCFL